MAPDDKPVLFDREPEVLKLGARILREFREFAVKGNAIDLAVGVILGTAFGLVVTSLVNDILLNLVAAIFGKPDFSNLVFSVNGAEIGYGLFITAIVNFLLVAWVLFFVVRTANRIKPPTVAATSHTCPHCLTLIDKRATRCPACTSDVDPVPELA